MVFVWDVYNLAVAPHFPGLYSSLQSRAEHVYGYLFNVCCVQKQNCRLARRWREWCCTSPLTNPTPAWSWALIAHSCVLCPYAQRDPTWTRRMWVRISRPRCCWSRTTLCWWPWSNTPLAHWPFSLGDRYAWWQCTLLQYMLSVIWYSRQLQRIYFRGANSKEKIWKDVEKKTKGKQYKTKQKSFPHSFSTFDFRGCSSNWVFGGLRRSNIWRPVIAMVFFFHLFHLFSVQIGMNKVWVKSLDGQTSK